MVQLVKDLVLSLQRLGHCCGRDLFPGLGTSICCKVWPKKKKKGKIVFNSIFCLDFLLYT